MENDLRSVRTTANQKTGPDAIILKVTMTTNSPHVNKGLSKCTIKSCSNSCAAAFLVTPSAEAAASQSSKIFLVSMHFQQTATNCTYPYLKLLSSLVSSQLDRLVAS